MRLAAPGSSGTIGVGVENLSITYQRGRKEILALDRISVEVRQGELLVLLGPSGCGKSTLLNAVAGLLKPDEGRITIAGREVFGSKGLINVPPNGRNLGMIFQAYSLWPHMTARENVAFPLKRRGFAQRDLLPTVNAALDLVRCGPLADQYPGQLSGGQQQRVALARAIVAEPAVLLFDEPLSNLDANLRRQLRDEIAGLHNRLEFSGIYVTHDQAEALSLGTSVAVMTTARIEQIGTPQEVHNSPVSEYVAWFLGANVFDATVDSRGAVDTPFGALSSEKTIAKGPARVAIYPERLRIEPAKDGTATITLVQYKGTAVEYSVQAGNASVNVVTITSEEPLAIGDRVNVNALSRDVLVFADPGNDTTTAAVGEPGQTNGRSVGP
ncbi:MAG: ABC transporter ATP-binding protein [Paracoccaceae bacterium]|nr:ABC transporter ATP-binding protein [Paracoccaceae bacterium]